MTGATLSQKIVKGRFPSPSQSTYAKFIIRVCASTAATADDSGKMDLFVGRLLPNGLVRLIVHCWDLGPSEAASQRFVACLPALHGHELLFPWEIKGSRLVSRIICTTFDTGTTLREMVVRKQSTVD